MNEKKRLYKSTVDRKIAGVCGGVAEYFDVDPTIVRLIWVAVVLIFGTGILLYIIAAIVMSDNPAPKNAAGTGYAEPDYTDVEYEVVDEAEPAEEEVAVEEEIVTGTEIVEVEGE